MAKFEIPRYQYLDPAGQLTAQAPADLPAVSILKTLYRLMVLTRVFDTKAILLQRTGKLGTYPSVRGQEAVFVGAGYALAPDDVYVPYYRDVGALIQRGARLRDILLFWGGDERGNQYASPHNFPYCVPIASQLLHAAGAATAIRIQQEVRAVLVTCGDGATSEGDFYEAINVAGVWDLPIVFIVSNNQWAISVPRSRQTRALTLAQKAVAAGIPGEQVDGNDVLAVQDRVAQALTRARTEHIPCVIEMTCYRQGDHTTADDASRYEPVGQRQQEWEKEPIARLRHYLETQQAWTEQDEIALQSDCLETVEAEIAAYLETPPEPLTAMVDYLYATLPISLMAQRDELAEREAAHG